MKFVFLLAILNTNWSTNKVAERNTICDFKDLWPEDPQFSSWISKASCATKARYKICIKDIDIVKKSPNNLNNTVTTELDKKSIYAETQGEWI